MKKPCSVPGCDRPSRKRTWCTLHYGRWRKFGTLDAPARKTELERFTEKYQTDPDTGCWVWRAAMHRNGYGGFSMQDDAGKWNKRLAHRISYELHVGPIPEGLTIDHLCRNRRCVNPEHLEPVTLSVNLLRGTGASARNAAKTHCKHGHPFDEENTRIRRGWRECKTCTGISTKEYEERQRRLRISLRDL